MTQMGKLCSIETRERSRILTRVLYECYEYSSHIVCVFRLDGLSKELMKTAMYATQHHDIPPHGRANSKRTNHI